MNERQRLLNSYLNGELTNVEIIELLVAEREKNERYRKALEEIAKETGTPYSRTAIKALENSEQ